MQASKAIGMVAAAMLLTACSVQLPSAQTPPAEEPTSGLACHVYKEPKSDVSAKPVVPVRKDLKGPLYKVVDVVDGDTIKVEQDGKTVSVRLLAMDTPEKSKTRYGHAEFYGEEASKHAQALIEASDNRVRLTYDVEKQDRYGRTLAYVWLKDGRMLNAVMVAEGYAYAYTVGKKPEYADTMLALMRNARAENQGLWATCD